MNCPFNHLLFGKPNQVNKRVPSPTPSREVYNIPYTISIVFLVFFKYYILLRKDRDLHLFTLHIVSCLKQMCQPVTLNKGGEKENEAAQKTSTLQHPER